MAVYKVTGDDLIELEPTSFERERVRERPDLQRLLRSRVDVLAPETLVIAEEFGDWEEGRRRIDLLAIDKEANLVVIELKRDDTGAHMELQAIRYAAMISTMTFDQAVTAHTSYLQALGNATDAARNILDFLDWEEPRADEFAREVRIVLVAAEFSKEITTAVLWLNGRSLDIRCVRLRPCKNDGVLFLDVQQVIPLPEAEEYQVRIREQSAERRTARTDTRDFTKYIFEEERLNKRRLVLAVVKAYVRDHPAITEVELEAAFPKELQRNEVFTTIEQARRVADKKGYPDHFLGEGETISLENKTEIAVSTRWGSGNLPRFLLRARELSFEIEADGAGGGI